MFVASCHILSPQQCIICTGSIPLTLFLLMTSHNIFNFCAAFEGSTLKNKHAGSCFGVHCPPWLNTWGGGHGGCDGTTNGNEKQTLNLTLFRGEIYSFYVRRSTTDRLPPLLLSLSSISIYCYLSSIVISIWFRHSLGEDNKWARGEESG